MKNKRILIIIFILTLSAFIFSKGIPELKVQKLSDSISVISGIGGNIAILKGKDNLLVIDTGVMQTGTILEKKIKQVFNMPVKLLINTHYHGDHTGGNKDVAEGSIIIAHKNCLATLKKNNEKTTAKKSKATYLPNEVFIKKHKIQFGNEIISLFHFGPGHTSGDTVVIFEKNKVVHTGDLFFHNIAPYIDVEDGSNTLNWVTTIKTLAKQYADFKVIPGHGEITDMKAYLKFADYLTYINESVAKAIKNGKTEKETVDSISFEKFTHVKEVNNFMTKENNVKWIYQGLTRNKK